MPILRSVARGFPPHYSSQEDLTAALAALWQKKPFNAARLASLHRNMLVGGRHHALPLTEYPALATFTATNEAYLQAAVPLAASVAERALHAAGLRPEDVDQLFFVTVTGVAVPSVDARVCNVLPFRRDLKRTPIFGLGCVAGAAGLARANDYVRAFPQHTALLVSVELCSLTLQRGDVSVANLLASGLFGDGAAAAVVVGDAVAQAPAPLPALSQGSVASGTPNDSVTALRAQVLGTHAVFYADTEGLLGWNVTSEGFRIVLSGAVPEVLGRDLRAQVDAWLARHDVARQEVAHWICHPGGPKIFETVGQCLEVEPEALNRTKQSLLRFGNLSSASVLLVLEDTANAAPSPGALGVVMAFGPGFCAEMVLIRWI